MQKLVCLDFLTDPELPASSGSSASSTTIEVELPSRLSPQPMWKDPAKSADRLEEARKKARKSGKRKLSNEASSDIGETIVVSSRAGPPDVRFLDINGSTNWTRTRMFQMLWENGQVGRVG